MEPITEPLSEPESLILQNFFCVDIIIKIGSMYLFSMEPMFPYREMLKFQGLLPIQVKLDLTLPI